MEMNPRMIGLAKTYALSNYYPALKFSSVSTSTTTGAYSMIVSLMRFIGFPIFMGLMLFFWIFFSFLRFTSASIVDWLAFKYL